MHILLSCISTKHSMLKKHWRDSKESREQTECPLTVLGSQQKPKEDQGGLLCVLNGGPAVQSALELSMPAGMAPSTGGVLVAALDTIHEVSSDLSTVKRDVLSLPAFNLLHSLTRTQRGYLVASTGLDAILEFTRDGEILWDWWATEHGFEYTPVGERRVIDKTADYRGIKFGTLAQTTHVNSAAELPDGRILASLFHQGMIIAIDRETGNWQPVLEGLDHPHSIRVLSNDYITLADTGRGRALMVKIKDGKGTIEREVNAETNWLQDSYYDYRSDSWILVDGKNTRVTVRSGTNGDRLLTQYNLDPEWRLYEAMPI
jgi:hypothetical protein